MIRRWLPTWTALDLLRLGWLVLAILVCVLPMSALDPALSHAMRTLDPGFTDLFRAITKAGDSRWYLYAIGATAPFLLAAGHWLPDRAQAARCRSLAWALLFVFVAIAVSGLLGDLIKILVGRARPKLLDQLGFYGAVPLSFRADYWSFPSGHAITAFSLYIALGTLLPKWRPALLAAALTIAASRVIVNAHYLSDILTGSLLGTLTTQAVRDRCRRGGWV